MISQTAEYALRAVVFLAEQEDTPHTIQQIARVTQVPMHYLSKVMQELARHGLAHSQRGLRGGFRLLVPPDKLTVYAVVQAVDPIRRIACCPLGNPAHRNQLCALHQRLDDTAAIVEKTFRESTVADLLTQPIFGTEGACCETCAFPPGDPAALSAPESVYENQ